MTAKTVHIISLGCPKNLIDSECMAGILESGGCRLTPAADEAEIIIVNTCAFILPAKEEAVEVILQAALQKKTGRCAHLIVTGCLPQRYGQSLAREMPEVDLFLGTAEVPRIGEHLDNLLSDAPETRRPVITKPTFLMDAGTPRLLSTPPHSAYLKIAEGCGNRCAYCVIPSIRGKLRSRPIDDVLREAETLIRQGVVEIIITAQDTTAYGKDLGGKPLLPDLLRALASLDGLRWIRLLYTHPAHLTLGILETIAEEEKICPYIDIPIQHIDDGILAAMGRRGGSRRIRKVIGKARDMIPGVALRTSLIVGFPGETADKFNRLLAFVTEARFDHLGVFTYSREEGTRAANLAGQVSERTKERRRQILMEEQTVISYEINRSLIDSVQEVLIEEKSDTAGFPFTGRCRRQAPEIDGITYVKGADLVPGQIVTCRITGADTYDLFAETVKLHKESLYPS